MLLLDDFNLWISFLFIFTLNMNKNFLIMENNSSIPFGYAARA